MGARAGILFDVDGTLVDTNYLHALAWSRAFRDAGEWAPTNAIHRLVGMGGDQLVVRLLGHPVRTAVSVALALAQIGEFSFILATAAVELQILPKMGSDLILAGALVSITLNAVLFRYIDKIQGWLDRHVRWGQQPQPLAEG